MVVQVVTVVLSVMTVVEYEVASVSAFVQVLVVETSVIVLVTVGAGAVTVST